MEWVTMRVPSCSALGDNVVRVAFRHHEFICAGFRGQCRNPGRLSYIAGEQGLEECGLSGVRCLSAHASRKIGHGRQ